MADRTLNIVGTIGDLVARVGRLEALGAARWGVRDNVAAYAVTSASDQSGITTATDLTDLTNVTWTGVAGRLYRATLSLRAAQITSTGTQTIGIYAGGTGVGAQIAETVLSVPAALLNPGIWVGFLTASGSTSVHARGATSAGTLLIQNSLQRGYLVVEDIGLA